MKKFLSLAFILVFALSSCSDEPTATPDTSNLVLNFTGLENTGSSHQYEGWIMVDGTPKSTGTFTVNSSGAMSKNSFSVNAADLSKATAFVLTLEPVPDNAAGPSSMKILGGDFSSNAATLSVAHSSAFGNNFTGASGAYMLATPTTSSTTDGKSGVWFIDASTGTAGFKNLPALAAGWVYEGWAVINGTPVSTGRFTMTDAADQSNIYSGPLQGPDFPGEDFITNAPTGLSFPTDLSNANIVLTIEPSPDNSPMPFNLKPLMGTVPANAVEMTKYTLNNQAATALPKGTATR